MAQIIDGKALSAQEREAIRAEVQQLTERYGRPPGLATVLVGNDPASQVYVHNKDVAARKVGFLSKQVLLPEETTQEELAATIRQLVADPLTDGILLQLPLPAHLDKDAAIALIPESKDVDGFTYMSHSHSARGGVAPCTPRAAVFMIKSTGVPIEGSHAVVIGRSELVGRPLASLLLAENATVTVAHSRTRNLKEIALSADILIAAVGRPGLVTGDMVKPGAVVIDVGINRLPDGTVVGDVDFASAFARASHITPVPGGVGPMTITMLLRNTVDCYKLGL